MVLKATQVLEDLESFEIRFKNIKNRLIQHYPDFVNTNDTSAKTMFNSAKSALESLYTDITQKEILIDGQIGANAKNLKDNKIKIKVAKNEWNNNLKKFNTPLRVNAASDELKIDKYNLIIEEYLKTFFYLFGSILMIQFVRS